MLHALPPCSFARASNSKTQKKTPCSPQCAFAIIQPHMTQGQGEGKVKLHTMNLLAAGSPLTDMRFARVFCSKYGGVSVKHSLSLTVLFPSFQAGKNFYMGFWLIPCCTWDGVRTHGRSVVLGHTDRVLC